MTNGAMILSVVGGVLLAELVARGGNPSGTQPDSPVSIILPVSENYTRWDVVHGVVEFTADSNSQLQLILNATPLVPDTIVQTSDGIRVAHVVLPLTDGQNTLAAHLQRDGSEPVREWVTFTKIPRFQSGIHSTQWGDESRFHMSTVASNCTGCHPSLASDSIVDVEFVAEECLSCHSSLLEKSRQHGPTQAGACDECHGPHIDSTRFSIPDRASDVCYQCHDNNVQKAKVHGPTATGQCTICHNPHATDNAYFLKKPAWNLCVSCHEEKASGVHVVAGFVFGESHPTHGWPDPTQPGKDFSCASCHDPHSSDSPYLWKYGAMTKTQLCIVCHQK